MTRYSSFEKNRRRAHSPSPQSSDASSTGSESHSDDEYVEHMSRSSSKTRRLRSSLGAQAAYPPEEPTASQTNFRYDDDTKAVAKGGVSVPFPWKLHEMLDDMAKQNCEHVVCWQPHGRSFMVHKPKEFVERIMPSFFNQTKYASFQRQLNLYGFSRLSHGRDKGAYYHLCFVRGQRNLCRGMVRQKIKGTKVRRSLAPEEEPNFYSQDWGQQKSLVPQDNETPPELVKSNESTQRHAEFAVSIELQQIAAPVSPNINAHGGHSSLSHLRFPPLPAVVSSGSSPGHTEKAVSPFVSSFGPKPASEALNSIGEVPIITPPTQTLEPSSNLSAPSFSNFAKGGDLLFFEGQPFRYLEHIDVVSPESTSAPLHMMRISSTNIAGLVGVTNAAQVSYGRV